MAENYIAIISGHENALVKVSDVVMIERNQRKLHIMTENREFEYYERIENVAPLLDGRFYPCLKGCYINLDRVSSMSDQSIRFDNGQCYNLGRENFIRAKQNYKYYLQKKMELERSRLEREQEREREREAKDRQKIAARASGGPAAAAACTSEKNACNSNKKSI